MAFLPDLIQRIAAVGDSRALKFVLTLLSAILLTLVYNLRAYRNQSTLEGMDSTQLARNISEGKGFTTLFIRPLSLHLLQKQRAGGGPAVTNTPPLDPRLLESHPDISNPPLYPLALAGLMKIAPFRYPVDTTSTFWSVPDVESQRADTRRFWRYEPDFLICVFNQLLLLVTVWVSFVWARKLFDRRVAWLSVVILLGTEVLWRFSTSGLSTMLLLLIFMALISCLTALETGVRHKEGRNAKLFMLAAAAGLLVGLGGLTRYSFAWLILPVLFFIIRFTESRGVMFGLTAVFAFAAAMTPWIFRNLHLSGTPLGTASFDLVKATVLFPGHQLERSLDPNVQFYPRLIWMKLFANVRPLLENDLFRIGGGAMAALFLVGLMIEFRSAAIRRMRYFLLMSLGVLILVEALGRTQLSVDSPQINSENVLVLLVPMVVVFGVSFFFLLLDRIPAVDRELRYLALGLFTAIACLPMIFALIKGNGSPVAYPPYYPPQIQQISGWMKERELIMSDVPWAVAWYGKRPSLWLTLNAVPDPAHPETHEDFFTINDRKTINALYLTPRTMDGRLLSDWIDAGELGWGSFVVDAVLRREVPSTFPLHEMPAGFTPRGIFLTDSKRWRKSN